MASLLADVQQYCGVVVLIPRHFCTLLWFKLECKTGATITGGTMTVEGCGSDSLQGDVRFAEVMGLMGATVQWQPFSITITGALPCGSEFACIAQASLDTPVHVFT